MQIIIIQQITKEAMNYNTGLWMRETCWIIVLGFVSLARRYLCNNDATFGGSFHVCRFLSSLFCIILGNKQRIYCLYCIGYKCKYRYLYLYQLKIELHNEKFHKSRLLLYMCKTILKLECLYVFRILFLYMYILL